MLFTLLSWGWTCTDVHLLVNRRTHTSAEARTERMPGNSTATLRVGGMAYRVQRLEHQAELSLAGILLFDYWSLRVHCGLHSACLDAATHSPARHSSSELCQAASTDCLFLAADPMVPPACRWYNFCCVWPLLPLPVLSLANTAFY